MGTLRPPTQDSFQRRSRRTRRLGSPTKSATSRHSIYHSVEPTRACLVSSKRRPRSLGIPYPSRLDRTSRLPSRLFALALAPLRTIPAIYCRNARVQRLGYLTTDSLVPALGRWVCRSLRPRSRGATSESGVY